MNNIKMIALDLDGTLMGHGYTISKANIDAIQKLFKSRRSCIFGYR